MTTKILKCLGALEPITLTLVGGIGVVILAKELWRLFDIEYLIAVVTFLTTLPLQP